MPITGFSPESITDVIQYPEFDGIELKKIGMNSILTVPEAN
jgi:hypothetical protein